jgi:hypothetical protein
LAATQFHTLKTENNVSQRLKASIPWVLSLAIVGYVLLSLDMEQLKSDIMMADMGRLIGIVSLFALIVFIVDSATLVVLFRRLIAPVNFKEVLAVKGVSYFFNAINYSAGSGAMALFLRKKRNVPFLKGLSALLWLNFVDVLVLLGMLVLGVALSGDLLPVEQREGLPYVMIAGIAIGAGALVYWQLDVDFLILGRLRQWRIFEAFRDASWSDYGHLMAVRGLFIGLYVLMNWLTLPCFDLHISFVALLVYTPLLTFVQIVPLSVSGLGAIQVAMAILYGHYLGGGTDIEAKVYAFSFVIGPLTAIIRIVIGYVFMTNVARDFIPKSGEIAAASEE